MKRFIQGEYRGQSTLLPESVDDYVSDTNPVRVEEILACHDANITAYVRKPITSAAKAEGRFNNDAFIYDSV